MLKGIDVSHYTDALNWKYVKKQGIIFASAKATDGMSDAPDSKFALHRNGAKTEGIFFQGYGFFRFCKDPIRQAETLIRVTGGVHPGDLPICLDVEWDRYTPHYGEGRHLDDAGADAVLACLERIEKLCGVTPMLYTNPFFFVGFPRADRFARFIPWLSAYHTAFEKVHLCSPWASFKFWQYADDLEICGVKQIDGDYFLGTMGELDALVKA